MDTIRCEKLIINCCKNSGKILSLTGVVTGAVMNLISKVDNFMLRETLRNLSKTKTQAEPEIRKVQEQISIPEAEKIQAQISPDPVSIPEAEKIEAQIPPNPVTKNDRRVISRRRSKPDMPVINRQRSSLPSTRAWVSCISDCSATIQRNQ